MQTKAIKLSNINTVMLTHKQGEDAVSKIKSNYDKIATDYARKGEYILEELASVESLISKSTSTSEIEAIIDELSCINELLIIAKYMNEVIGESDDETLTSNLDRAFSPGYTVQYKAISSIVNTSDKVKAELLNHAVDKGEGLRYGLPHYAKLRMKENMTSELVSEIMEDVPCTWELIHDFECISL